MVVEGIGEDRKSKKGKCNRTENSENKGEKWMSKEWAKLKAISKSWKSRLGRDEPHVGCGQKEKRLKYVKYPPLYVECDIIQFFHIQTERIFDNKNKHIFFSILFSAACFRSVILV